MNRAATIAKGALALILLAALAGGIPWALWHFIGWPLPHHLPGWHQLSTDLTQHGIADTTLLKALACVVWVAWAVLIASLAVEIPASIRGRTAHIAVGGPLQPMVAQLLAAVAIAALSITPRPTTSNDTTTLANALSPGPPARPVPAMALSADASPARIDLAASTSPSAPASVPAVAGQSLRSYVVQRNDTLWGIAERELGDPLRWRDIYSLNQDRLQPDGTRLADPHWIDPGWTLLLPEDGPSATPETPPPSNPESTATGATAPTVSSEGDGTVTYTVRPGDSLWQIATDCLGVGEDWPSLWAANRDRPEPDGAGLVDPSLIRPGWQLTIPAPDGRLQQAPIATPDPPPAQTQPSTQAPTPRTPGGNGTQGSSDATHAPAVHPGPGIDLPGGYIVGAALGSAVGAALAAARIHRRRRRIPAEPAPVIALKDSLNNRTTQQLLRRADPDDPPRTPEGAAPVEQPPPPGVVAIGRSGPEELRINFWGGVCLLGDDSRIDIARAATVALLAQPPADTQLIIAGTGLAARMLGSDCRLPGLTIVEELSDALRKAEVELVARNRILDQLEVPDADSLAEGHPEERFVATVIVAAAPSDLHVARLAAVLSAGRHLALGGLLLDSGPAEVTIEADVGRRLSGVVPGEHPLGSLLGTQLYGLGASEAAEIVSALTAGRGLIPDGDSLPEVAFPAPEPPRRPTIKVSILGGCRIVTRDGTEVIGLREKAKELLAYLLVNPDGVPADRATEALWPEADPRRGRDRFRTVLSNLRSQLADALGEPASPPVERNGPICRVDPTAVDCDLWRFEAALAEAREASTAEQKRAGYARAAQAYGGDLLDGADCIWVEAPREKLRDLAVAANCRLAELAQGAGDEDAAVAALERAVDLDPYGEETARRLIGIHGAAGNTDAARRVYRRLSRVLQDDLDVDPSAETRALIEGILRRCRDRAPISVPDP